MNFHLSTFLSTIILCLPWYFHFLLVCTDGDVRVQNETYDYSNSLTTIRGRVTACVNGSYHPVCDIGWDNSDAQVVCRNSYGSNYGKKFEFIS